MSTESPGETLVPPQVEATMKSIPDAIAVPPGNEVFLLGHASGTQNYICLPSATGFDWASSRPRRPCSTMRAVKWSPTTSAPLPPNPIPRSSFPPGRPTTPVPCGP